MKLNELLSSLLVLRQKIHGAHWTVEGSTFKQLHDLFGEQYTDILKWADVVAEDIRILGAEPPVRLTDILKLSVIRDDYLPGDWEGKVSIIARDMNVILEDLEKMPRQNRGIDKNLDDIYSYLSKQKWMLNSFLG